MTQTANRSRQLRRSASPLLGPDWTERGLAQVGWMLLPLRLFLGVTFTYAALQKFSDPSFFGSTSPTSVQAQMRALAPSSPIGWLVDLTLHAGPLVGILIAAAELVVGLATLLGLKLRWVAAVGAVLALTFFLTVSWNTRPYYYGADIVFLFAWTPFLSMGAADVLSIDGYARARAAATPRSADQSTVESLVERRAIVATAGAAALIAAASAAVGSVGGSADDTAGTTVPRRGANRGTGLGNGLGTGLGTGQRPGHEASSTPQQTSPASSPSAPAGMTEVARLADLPTGSGKPFHDPSTGNPAWLVRTRTGAVAFSAVCTHAGCPVSYEQSANEFICPCHGGTYSAATGAVLGGPPPAPLPRLEVKVVDGRVYVR